MAILHYHLDDELKARLIAQSEREERSIRATMIRALERYLAEEEPKRASDAAA